MEDKEAAVLVVAPHHDDAVIGCGGTIASLAHLGHKVDIVYMTEGYSGVPQAEDRAKATTMREAEAEEANRILGVRNQIFLRYPDRDLSYSLQRVQDVVRLLRGGDYRGVYFPHDKERDHDHRVAHEIVGEASWMAASDYFPELGATTSLTHVMMYEVWTPLQRVNFKQDISEFLELKIQALRAYGSQFSEAQAERIVGLNLYRGAMSSRPVRAVEAFRFYAR